MADIIQIFKSVHRIEKTDYHPNSRQGIGVWDAMVSRTGFLKEGTITLPLESQNEPKLENAELIIIQDIKGFDPFAVNKNSDHPKFPEWEKKLNTGYLNSANLPLKGFSSISKPWTFEIFEFRKTENDSFEVWLNSPDKIGLPKREVHKIAELKIGMPIRFKINGKDDFTLTGRKQRTFSEFDYLIEFVGKADKIEFNDLNKIEQTKNLPISNCKVVDERKFLI